jgi:hypothetical protein
LGKGKAKGKIWLIVDFESGERKKASLILFRFGVFVCFSLFLMLDVRKKEK